VLAQCWKPFGKAQQICCEQIEIKARSESWPNLSPILLALTAADLPIVFWCRHSGALSKNATGDQERGFETLLNLATKSIFDARGVDPEFALERIEKWRRENRVIADLEWTRLTPWREPLAQIFDNPARENKFSSFHTIEIAHPEEKPTAQALYMAGWLSAPYKARVVFKRVEGFGPGLHGVVLRADSETITFERTSCECLRIFSTNRGERRYSYSDPKIEALMKEELSIIGNDPAFDIAFERAREIVRERA
jgi:hypothetical protein